MTTGSYLISQGYDNLRKHGSKTFSTMLIICATMFVLGLFIILFVNIQSNVDAVSKSQGLQAFISDKIADSEIETLASKISGISNVKSIKYIDKDDALEDAKETLKDYAYLLEGMENTNPFPRSFIITFENLENTENVKSAIESVDGIYKVSYNEKIIDAVISISRIGNYAIIAIGFVMMIVSVFIISNTIKLAVYSNKREIYIMKYLGATSRFIKTPFIVEGIIMGLASSVVSWIIVTLGYTFAYRYLPKVGAELGVFGFVPYKVMWYIIFAAFVILGVILGWIGSSLATRKYLKESRPEKIKLNNKKTHEEKIQEKRERMQEKEQIRLTKETQKREDKENKRMKADEKKDFERKRKARRITILILTLLVLSPIVSVFAQTTQQKIDDINEQSNEATKKYNQVQADIKIYEADIEKLDSQVESYSKQVDELTSSVETAKEDVEKIATELQNVSTNYEATEELLNARLRVLYENGFVNMWEVLLSAENLTDFIAKYNVLSVLIENDKATLKAMQDEKKYIQNLKESADLKRLQVEQAEYDVQKSKEALEAAKLNKENKLSQLEGSKQELKDLLAKLKKEKETQEKILAQERAAAGNSNLVFNGEFTWPAPGVYYITALFRDKEYYNSLGLMHYGTDIAKSGGCPIVAAQSGTVISAGWNNYGYGNYVQIDHGTGSDGKRYVTLYAHLKTIYVKKGQYVSKGEQIGYMGTTGFSTGTHLHFEIIQNGTKINAMNYYPELAGTAVYYSYGRWISFPFNNMAKYQI